MSKITDYNDRSNAILWGDGAGAVILSGSNKEGILSTHIHSDGNFENLFIPGFNKVLTENPYGAGINYTISYQLPIYKK